MLKFYYNLFREKRAFGPDKQFKRSLQKKLQTAWGELYPSRLMWYQMPAFKYSMVALAVLIFVSTTGVGAYAYNSPEVTEGTRLYGIKKVIENVEEKVVERRAPEVQAKFYLKQIERREAEKRIVERRRAHEVQLQKTEEKIERTEKKLEIINVELNKTPEKIKDGVLKKRIEKRLEIMRDKGDKIEAKIEKAEEKLEKNKNLNLNQKPYEESNPSISSDDGGVGNGNASTSSEATGQGKANGKSVWSRVKRVLNPDASPSQVRTSTSVNTRWIGVNVRNDIAGQVNCYGEQSCSKEK